MAAAALNYFGKSLDELDVAEVAFLAALPKAPSAYDPALQSPGRARPAQLGDRPDGARTATSPREQAQAAIAEPLITQTRAIGSQTEDADYFVEEVRRQLYARYGEQALYDGGLQVRSTLDTTLQNYAVNALRAGLVRYDRRHGWRGAISNINVAGNWKDTLAAAENQSGIDTWRSRGRAGVRRQIHARSALATVRPEPFRSANSRGRARNCATRRSAQRPPNRRTC